MSASTTSDPPAQVGRERYWRILIPICLVFGVVALDRSNIAVAVPAIATDFQLSTIVVGVVLSAFYWGYVPLQIPSGLFGQYVSGKWLIVGAILGWAVGTVLTGLSRNLTEVILCRILVGISEGAAVPTLLMLIGRWFPLQERGRASSAFFIAGQVGNLLATAVTGLLIAATSWHTMFFLEAIPAVIVAAVVAIWLTDDPDKDPRLSVAERDWLRSKREEELAETGKVDRERWHRVIRSPLLWAFVVVWFISSVGSYGLAGWVPTVVKDVTEAGIGSVGLFAAIPYLLAIVLLVIVGFVSDHLRRRDIFIIAGFALAGLAIFFGPSMPGAVPKLAVIFLGAGCNSAITGIIIAWLEDLTPRSHFGLALGIIQFFGQMAGIVAPLAVGVVAGSGPATDGLWIIGVVLLIGAALAVVIYAGVRRRVAGLPTPGLAGSQ